MSALVLNRPVRLVWSASVAACVAIGGALLLSRPPEQSATVADPASSHGLANLPLAAQESVSAALGREMPAYRVVGLSARNPAQGFDVRFSAAGVSVVSGGGRVAISFAAVGRGDALRPAGSVVPQVRDNNVTYPRGALVEWWANGPLGLEQGFDVAARPRGGAAPVRVALALSRGVVARMVRGSVVLSARLTSLAYGDLVATDARGRVLRSWLAVRGQRLFIQVDDRGAKYPLRIDPVISQSAKLTAANAPDLAGLGWSVAASGNTIVVGAPEVGASHPTSPGAAYVFEKPRSGWAGPLTQTGVLTPSNGRSDDHFGWSVGESGDTIVVGALGPFSEPGQVPAEREVYVFVRPRTGWAGAHSETARLTTTTSMAGGYFGHSVAVAGDTVVVGAPGRNVGTHVNQGEAFVFVRPRSGWSGTQTQTATLSSSDGRANDTFGWSVAVAGNAVAVGAPQHARGRLRPGQTYMFVKPRAGWARARTQTATLAAPHGLGVATGWTLAMSGDAVVTGSNGSYADGGRSGVAWVYARPPAGWDGTRGVSATLKVPARASDSTCGTGGLGAGYEFGSSLAMSGDTIVGTSGAHGSVNHEYPGEACVFTKPASGWSGTITQATTLVASDSRGADLFGSGAGDAAAVSGGTVVVGAPDHRGRGSYGEAYVWTEPLSSP